MDKNTDSYFIAKEVKRDTHIKAVLFIELVITTVCLIMLCLLMVKTIQQGDTIEPGDMTYDNYEMYSERFGTHAVILNVSRSCEDSVNPVRCVFDRIPMIYDYSRINESFPLFRMPSDYFIFGGVCRDYTLYRHSALSNLNINCLFDFSEENHVFLMCSYNDRMYELNNGRIVYHGRI